MNVKTKESKPGKAQLIGWGEATILSINPDKDQLLKIYEVDLNDEEAVTRVKEPEYIGEKEGVETARIDVFVKNVKTSAVDKITFFLENKARLSKSEKTEFINQLGENQWSDNEDNLWDNFKNFQQVLSWVKDRNVTEKYVKGAKPNETEIIAKKKYRAAFVGESDLMNFIKNWLLGVDYRNTETDLLLDMKKVFQGNFKELQSLLKMDVGSVVVNYAIKSVEKDGEMKDYQTISNKFFMQGTNMRMLRNYGLTPEKLDIIKEKYASESLKKSLTPIEKFFAEVSDTENGISKGNVFYVPLEATEYDPNMNYVTTTDSVVVNDSNSDY